MMEYIFLLVVLSYLGVIIIRTFRTYYYSDKMLSNKISRNYFCNSNFILLLPALSEQSIVEETLNYFNELIYDKRKLKIIIITTQREEFERNKNKGRLSEFISQLNNGNDINSINNGLFPIYLLPEILLSHTQYDNETFIDYVNNLYLNYPTTQQVTNDYIIQNKTKLNFEFLNIHYPYNEGNKSNQLNYALNTITSIDRTFIGVYDFDSKPDKNTLLEVDELSTNKNLFVFQQISMPLLRKNIKLNFTENAMIEIYHLMQCRRNIGIEYWMHVSTCEYTTPLRYCMGAGLFIEINLIKKYKFTEPIDDIPLGYKFNYSKIKITPLKLINLVYMVNKLSDLKGQSININYGLIVGIFKELKWTLNNKVFKMSKIETLIKIFNTFFTIFIIPITSMTLTLIILYSLSYSLKNALIYLAILILGYGISSIIVWKRVKKLYLKYNGYKSTFIENDYHLYFFFLSFLRGLIRAILRFRAIILIVKRYWSNIPFITSKTQR